MSSIQNGTKFAICTFFMCCQHCSTGFNSGEYDGKYSNTNHSENGRQQTVDGGGSHFDTIGDGLVGITLENQFAAP
jgi:hypothetical protein